MFEDRAAAYISQNLLLHLYSEPFLNFVQLSQLVFLEQGLDQFNQNFERAERKVSFDIVFQCAQVISYLFCEALVTSDAILYFLEAVHS